MYMRSTVAESSNSCAEVASELGSQKWARSFGSLSARRVSGALHEMREDVQGGWLWQVHEWDVDVVKEAKSHCEAFVIARQR